MLKVKGFACNLDCDYYAELNLYSQNCLHKSSNKSLTLQYGQDLDVDFARKIVNILNINIVGVQARAAQFIRTRSEDGCVVLERQFRAHL